MGTLSISEKTMIHSSDVAVKRLTVVVEAQAKDISDLKGALLICAGLIADLTQRAMQDQPALDMAAKLKATVEKFSQGRP